MAWDLLEAPTLYDDFWAVHLSVDDCRCRDCGTQVGPVLHPGDETGHDRSRWIPVYGNVNTTDLLCEQCEAEVHWWATTPPPGTDNKSGWRG